MIKIDLVDYNNYPELFEFETKNRAFFESILPPRPKSYHNYCTFVDVMDTLISEQDIGDFYMYIIRNVDDKMVGRINLQLSKGANGITGEVGYRMDQDFQGQGFASRAVEIISQSAFLDFGVKELIAGTSKENIGSIKVLERNGFKQTGLQSDVMRINGRSVEGLVFSLKDRPL